MTAYTNFARSVRSTPQTQKVFGREKEQVFNNAGGAVFSITPLQQFRRFLILGSAKGSYYVSEQKLTRENAKVIVDLFNSDQGVKAVELLAEISDQGLAPKVSPTIFALALAFASPRRDVKRAAKDVFQTVIRTQSHLFEFMSYVRQFRGMGRVLRETVRAWYQDMPADKLAYQVCKYRQRFGYTTRDVLRLVKPVPVDEGHNSVYEFATRVEGRPYNEPKFDVIRGYEEAKNSEVIVPDYITKYGLTHEMLPTEWLNSPLVWEALLEKMPLTAMIRNLGKMTSIELLKPFSQASKLVVDRLSNEEYLRQSRIHPFNILLALTTYKQGRGVKGDLTWSPVPQISDALENAFYKTFENIEPTGKRILIALDVSASMSAPIMNTHLSCCEAGAALSLFTARTESQYYIMGFQDRFVDLNIIADLGITAEDSITSAAKKAQKQNFGTTDAAVPFLWGMENRVEFDAVMVVTDNETWVNPRIHPFQAKQQYAQKMGIDPKLIVVGMTSTRFSIADPRDPNSLDVVGFDASVPKVMSDFIRGDI